MQFARVVIGVGLWDGVVCANDFERTRVARSATGFKEEVSVNCGHELMHARWGFFSIQLAAYAPSMSYDNVVEGRVSAPKSGETDFNDHGVGRGWRFGVNGGERSLIKCDWPQKIGR